MAGEQEVKQPTKEELLQAIDNQEEEVGQVADETPQEVELSEVEQEASHMGWTPKEDWIKAGHDPKEWRPADVWLDRGRFFSTINSLKNELQVTKQQVGEAYQLGRKMAEAALQDELRELRQEKKDALAMGDLVKADEIQEQIDLTKEKKEREIPPPVPRNFAPPPEFELFVQRNPWYNSNKVLRYTADAIGAEYMQTHKGATPADLYFFVENTMRQEMEKITGSKVPGQPKEKIAPMVEEGGVNRGGSKQAGGGGSLSSIKSGMNEFERSIMRNIIASTPNMTEEKYLKEYSKVKDK